MATGGIHEILLFSVFSILLFIKQVFSQISYSDVFIKGSACLYGRLQSPIEMLESNSSYIAESTITSVNYLSVSNIFLNFNERVLKVSQDKNTSPNFGSLNYRKKGFISEYSLIDIEIYNPAEHRLKLANDTIIVNPDIEVKLIHKKNLLYVSDVNSFRNFTEANSYLIVSLLYKLNASLSDNGFLTDLNSFYNSQGNSLLVKTSFDLNKYNLIKNNQYFMYDGSFSYYPCDENVSYIVVKDIFYISPSDLSTIQSRYSTKWANGIVNKQIAKQFGRPIYTNYRAINAFYLSGKNLWILISSLFLAVLL